MNIKTGIDYFPFDIDFFQDEKIQFVSARFGTKGEAITIRLLCKVYRNGYYYNWDEDTALLFAKSVGDGCSDSCVNDVVYELVKRGFFDRGIFDRFSILTSRGIQKRYLEAGKRRKNLDMEEALILVDVAECQNVNIINEDVNILSKNADISKQNAHESKVKERESKGKEKRVYGELAHVRLSDDEYQKLIDAFGQAITDQYIEKVDLYIGTNGKRYKSHYAVIRQWINRDQEKGKNRQQSGNQFLDMLEQEGTNG